jgi:uncharacterized oligopeptide transporter (OPT) family protein
MGLFQRPSAHPDEVAPLLIPPEEVATFDEETWYRRAFRGEAVPQLTIRAVVTGSLIGFLLSFTNIYIGLKSGFTANVAITACLLSFSLWATLRRAGLAGTPLSILESNCMQSTASAAGYSTGTMLNAAIPALLLLTVTPLRPGGTHLPPLVLGLYIFFMALLGTVMAIPMKRAMINHERLRFPSGTAAAVALQTLYSHGAEAMRKARALLVSALLAATTPLLMDLRVRHGDSLLPSSSRVFDFLPGGAGRRPSEWTVVLDHKFLLVAVGMLVGLPVASAMLLGSVALDFVVGPIALGRGAVVNPSLAWLEIGLWIGAPMMVASGLMSLLMGWRAALRGLRSLADVGRPNRAEVPPLVFVIGLAVSGAGVMVIGNAYLDVGFLWGALAVALSFVLALVSCRVTGETDFTPIGAMGTVTQLTFGALLPNNPTANLGTAAIAGSAASSAADLLTDLKSGYLLGASPRRQFAAQVLGIIPGTIAAAVGYYLLVPDATALTGKGGAPALFPAPAAQMWAAMARLLTGGSGGLHPFARHAILVGAILGVVLTLGERLPRPIARWVPSPTGLGLGFTMPFQYGFSMFVGAALGWLWFRRRPGQAERYLMPIASGVIAGESVLGVVVVVINNLFF